MNVEKEDLSAFQCRRCGACCKWEGPVRVTEQEIDAIADYLGIELQRFIRDYTYLTPDRRNFSGWHMFCAGAKSLKRRDKE